MVVMEQENQLLKRVLYWLDEMKITDVISIDVRSQTVITDYMVIGTGRSSRQVKAAAVRILEAAKAENYTVLHHSGLDSGDWALIDLGDVIVHLMQSEIRDYYNLEGLWQEI